MKLFRFKRNMAIKFRNELVSVFFTGCKINRYEEILHLVRETHWKTGIMKGHWKIERQAT